MNDTARRRFKVGIDNYGLLPLRMDPVATLEWASDHGAEGVAFSGFPPDQARAIDEAVLDDLAACARSQGLYVEWGGAQHIPRDMTSWAASDVFEVNRSAARAARRAGACVIRSCSGGLMRWSDCSPSTETLLRETASALVAQRAMLEDHGVVLAIETHFEFTSFELVRLLEMCEAEPGGWLGICLDTMNLLTMAEEPVRATRRLLPWVVSTHIKDGALLFDADGIETFTAPIGRGVIDLPAVLELLASLCRTVHLSVEDHAGSFRLPIHDPLFLARLPDLSVQEFAALARLAARTAADPGCRPLPRAEWGSVCERRMAADVPALRAMADDIEAGDARRPAPRHPGGR